MSHLRMRGASPLVARAFEQWIARDKILDAWHDTRMRQTIVLYGLSEPLHAEGYAVVARKFDGSRERTLVMLRDGDTLGSVARGEEIEALRRRERSMGVRESQG